MPTNEQQSKANDLDISPDTTHNMQVNSTRDDQIGSRNFRDQDEIYTSSGTIKVIKSEQTHQVIYLKDGVKIEEKDLPSLDIRIANGGGGQSGLVEALAKKFLETKSLELGSRPIAISWRGTNTEGSLKGLKQGIIDIAVVYERNEEIKALRGGAEAPYAEKVAHVWMEHLDIIGPQNNSAKLNDADSIVNAIDKIMLTPNAFWLTRNDNSATNEIERKMFLDRLNQKLEEKQGAKYKAKTLEELINEGKEAVAAEKTVRELEEQKSHLINTLKSSELCTEERKKLTHDLHRLNRDFFIANLKVVEVTAIVDGVYKKGFYREVKALPNETVTNANQLGYYTLSENGTFYAMPNENRNNLRLFLNNFQKKLPELLLPADALLTNRPHNKVSEEFLGWMAGAGQEVIENYKGKYSSNQNDPSLYRGADQEFIQELSVLIGEHGTENSINLS